MASDRPVVAVVMASSASGGACVDALLTRHAGRCAVRAVFRSDAKAAVLRERAQGRDDVEVVTGVDAWLPSTLGSAFAGARVAVVVTPHDPSRGFADDANLTMAMLRAAVDAGVAHIVYVGSWTVHAAEEVSGIASRFIPVEALLKEMHDEKGVTWTTLRGGFFFTNFEQMFGSLRSGDKLVFPDITVPANDPRDIGRVAAAVAAVSGAGHEQRAYEISGPEYISSEGMAKQLSDVLGRSIIYNPVTAEEYGKNLLPPLRQMLAYLEKTGKNAVPLSTDVESVTGTAPISFRQWAEENKSAFALA